LIAGERRWRARQLAGLTAVPVIIKTSPQQMLELALVENIQRADLNPWKKPKLCQLMENLG
jgi:ParB family chromosome partitioning protein